MRMDGVEDKEGLFRRQAALLLDGRHLGKSPALNAMLEFLVRTSIEGRAPKEIEVAAAVFDRGDAFDATQDASVRVYAHRLRKKLDEYYAGEGAGEAWRILMPKGEYRLLLEPARQDVSDVAPAVPRAGVRLAVLASIGTALACLAIAVIVWMFYLRPDGPDRTLAAVRETKLWASTVIYGKPIVVVMGDYYIFGEADATGGVRRLVREFSINSRYDLDERVMQEPRLNGRYRDMGLRYYPIGVATALRDIMPILRTSGRRERPVRVIPASDLTPDMLRISNVVYIGYLSGLGALRNPVFNGSRFAVGNSYDELIDRRGGAVYTATAGDPGVSGPRQDYGYISTFAGPNGNRIVIIAGSRDAGVMQAADYASQLPALADLDRKSGSAPAFEALLRVDTLGDQNLAGKLVLASPLNGGAIWRGGTPQRFPDDAHPLVPPGW